MNNFKTNVPETEQGLYRKYLVKRLRDAKRKHVDCEYFVLDLDHDRYAAPALRAYADACADQLPELAYDLRTKASSLERRYPAGILQSGGASR